MLKMSSGARVSIPGNVRRTIQDIKEITGNHSEDEIYAMLKECSMEPNETAQKLLLQDPFREVKRKRDRRKENLNKESGESRWKAGAQGRGNRGGRGNYLPHHVSHDAGGGRNSGSGKENGLIQVSDKAAGSSSLTTPQEPKNKETTSSALTVIANGPPPRNSSFVHALSQTLPASMVNQSDVPGAAEFNKLDGPPSVTLPINANKRTTVAFSTGDTHKQPMPVTSSYSASKTSESVTEPYFSASDPVLVPSQDSQLLNAVGTIRREVGSQRTPVEQISITPAPEGNSFGQGKMLNRSPGVGTSQLSESSHRPSSAHGSSSGSRPSSNYGNRSQVIGPHRAVGPVMEWKPKPTTPVLAQQSGLAVMSEVLTVSVEANTQSPPGSSVLDSKEATSELQRKLEKTQISDSLNVIIPNHLHVPEAEKLGFCFGSFDSIFGLSTSSICCPENKKSPLSLSETSEGVEDTAEEQPLSNQNALESAEEANYADHPQSSSHVPEDLSPGEVEESAVLPDYESKQETVLPPGSHQYSMVHASPTYGYGFMPQILGSQLASFESSDSQARDVSRVPSFVVPQPFDPTSYYAQFYRSGADSDGRVSPFHSSGVVTKYNGNAAVLGPQTSQSPQEGGSPLVLSTTGSAPLVTQPAGVMQSSIAVTQQPLPVFRQPTGMPLPHYPPNYIPYGHYFSPFYVQPQAIPPYLSNSSFPQHPQAGGAYPTLPAATTKYSLSQYKPGTNTGNSSHIGVPGSYGPYGSSPAGYNPSSAPAGGNSTSNEDLAASQFRESNVYVTGQQSEGSGVWIAAPGRDISGLQASSLYNFPQGQVAFTPTQGGHGSFAGIYHPAQPVTAATVHPLLQQSQTIAGAVDMGPAGSVYQQQQQQHQHAQMNGPAGY